MRIYRYYDKINGKNVYLKVTDEVAKFLQNSDKQWQRQQEECYEHNISLNKVLYEDDDDNPIMLEDVVPDRTKFWRTNDRLVIGLQKEFSHRKNI